MNLCARKMTDQCVLQCVSQCYSRTLEGIIRLIIAHAKIKIGLLPVGIQHHKNRRIVCGNCIKNRGELICYRFTFFVDHLVNIVESNIVDQILFQRLEFTCWRNLHLVQARQVTLSKSFFNNLQTIGNSHNRRFNFNHFCLLDFLNLVHDLSPLNRHSLLIELDKPQIIIPQQFLILGQL